MEFYDNSIPTVSGPAFDAAFFNRATLTDVFLRDANGDIVTDATGAPLTERGEVRDLLVSMAGDRAAAIAITVNNQRLFVEQGNSWIKSLAAAAQEIERARPSGVNEDKTPKSNINGLNFSDSGGNVVISAEAANTLLNVRDSVDAQILSKYFNFSNAEYSAWVAAYLTGSTAPFPGFTTSVTLTGMRDSQSFAVFDNEFKSAVDQATQRVQLDQTTFQGLVSRQNNAIETMADLERKFNTTLSKLVSNLRPSS